MAISRIWLGAQLIILNLLLLASSFSLAQEAAKESAANAGKMFGEFLITSNYMEQAVSDSNNSWSVQPTLGMHWLRGELGIRSSNVQFPDNGESLNIRPYAWYLFVFAPTVEFKVRYDLNMYFASNSRNGNIFTFDLNLWTHHAIIENISNWYGSGSAAYWLAYGHSWVLPAPGLEYKLEAGYLMVNANNYSGYIGVQTGLGYKYGDFYYELLGSFNSNSGQFANGTANSALWVQISTRF